MNLTDYIFFAVAVFLVTLIIFNLLVAIFTDTYDEIKQNEKAIELKMMNEVIMDMESYMQFFLPQETNLPQHLCYVEYQKKQHN